MAEDLGHLTLDRKGVHGTRRCVEVRVSSRPGRDKDNGVDDGRQDLDLGVVNGNDPRRGSGGTRLGVEETVVVVRDQDRDEEDTQDIEDDETEENLAQGQQKKTGRRKS